MSSDLVAPPDLHRELAAAVERVEPADVSTGQAEDAGAGRAGQAGAPEALLPSIPAQVPPYGYGYAIVPARRNRFLTWPVVSLALVALVVAAGCVWWFGLRTDRDEAYVQALRRADLSAQFPSSAAAVAHAKSFCLGLETGEPLKGYATDRIGVSGYCPQFLRGFEVVPTPEEEDTTYLEALRKGGFAGTYASDAAAVAAGRALCRGLADGGKPQGLPVDAVALPVYCPSFTSAFKVLRTAHVKGTFELQDYSIYSRGISNYGSSCEGTGGYSDIGPGTEVIVKDGSGKTIAHTQLGSGTGGSYTCSFSFSMDVLEGADDYVVQVSHRGELHKNFTELENDGVALTLGS